MLNFLVKKSQSYHYKPGEPVLNGMQAINFDKQNDELKKLYVNMQHADYYIRKQQAEHARLTQTDNFVNRNNY